MFKFSSCTALFFTSTVVVLCLTSRLPEALGQAQPTVTVGSLVEVGGPGVETSIAVNPCDSREAVGVWFRELEEECPSEDPLCETLKGMNYSIDGGTTWSAYEMLDRWQIDPTITFHPLGTYAFNAVQGGGLNGVRRVQMGPPPANCEVPVDCSAGAAAAQGGSSSVDIPALAEWTVSNVPTEARLSYAERCESAAVSASDPAEADRLRRFAELIRP